MREAGFLLPLFAVILTAALWLPALERYLDLSWYWIALVSFSVIFWQHISRKDGIFLAKIDKHVWRLLIVEYALLALCFALPFLVKGRYALSLAPFLAVIVAFFPLKRRKNKRVIGLSARLRLPLEFYEFQSVLRKQPIVVVALFGLSILTYVHVGFFLAFLILFAMILPSVFEHNENRALAPASWSNLLRKNRNLLTASLILSVPSLVLGLLFHLSWWPLFLYGVCSIVVLFQLYFWHKYKTWTPYHEQNSNASVAMIGFFSLLLPGFILVGFALALRYFFLCKNLFRYARR